MKRPTERKNRGHAKRPARTRRPAEEMARLKRQALVAERLRFEALRQRPPLTSIDASLLSAGIAHEFNNILGAADGHAAWALESGKLEDMREALEVVLIACRRSAQITRALQGLSQPQEDAAEVFGLDEILGELDRIWGSLCFQRNVRLSVERCAEASIYGHPAQVLEILVNLVKNAVEASPSPTRIEVSARRKSATKRAAARLEIRVRDNGPGVAEPYREAIFKPFFTSKGSLGSAVGAIPANQTGGGTGLGLFLSRWLAQQHGGDLILESSGPEGSVFLLTLPLSAVP